MQELVNEYEDHEDSDCDLPEWLCGPDFFFPSKNIKNLMTNSNDCFYSDEIDRVSNMIAVSKEEIVGFIQEVRSRDKNFYWENIETSQ
jgi:hypothetical protein